MNMQHDDDQFMNYWYSWFAGFVDGEGHFSVDKRGRDNLRTDYKCRLIIGLRNDDRPVLEEIRGMLGMGMVYERPVSSGDRPNSHPRAIFQVDAIKDCIELVEIFERFPLRAKKQRDFSVWRCAVFELKKPVAYRNTDLLEYYFKKIKHVRKYDKQLELEKPVIVEPQLMIDF